jgi:hypothetical protein
MNEPELDDLLRRYRPAGPPPALRARVMAGVPDVRRTWPWAAAAAALLAATVYLHQSADDAVARTSTRFASDVRRQAIASLSEMLGGDASAQMIAELTISADEFRAERDRMGSESIGGMESR